MNGNPLSQRMEYYSKYKKSLIFNETNPPDKSQNITQKITNSAKKGKKQTAFSPKFKNDISDKERYYNQYYEREDIVIPKDKVPNLKKSIIKSNNANGNKTPNKEAGNNNHKYSAIDKYMKEFSTSSLSPMQQNPKTKTLMKKSKSFWQSRSKAGIVLEGNEKMNHKTRRIDFMASNIFNRKEKEEIILKTQPLSPPPYRRNIPKDNHDNHKQSSNKTKATIASVFDWKYSNTELSNKTHIRSKTLEASIRKQRELQSHFQDQQVIKPLLKTKSKLIEDKAIDMRPKQKNTPVCPDKEIEQYEIHTRKNFENVDAGKIKQMLLSKGIHVFNYEDLGSCVNGYQSGKITFNIRRDKSDNIQTKMSQIANEIQSMGLGIRQIVKDTHHKKERPQTPGKELLKSAKTNQPKAKSKSNADPNNGEQ